MESIAAYTRQLQAVLNRAMDIEMQLKHLANAIDFTPEDWRDMYTNHRPLANQLSRIVDKYGTK